MQDGVIQIFVNCSLALTASNIIGGNSNLNAITTLIATPEPPLGVLQYIEETVYIKRHDTYTVYI